MRKFLRRTTTLAAIIVLASGTALLAQPPAPGGHTHKAPHGGDIVEVAEHHIEFKADSSGAISVWVLNAKQKTIAPPAGASVTLMGPASAQVTLPLQVEATGQRLSARFDPANFPSFQAVVRILIAGSKRNLRFRYPGHH